MTAIARTAYPRPGAKLTRQELEARCTLSESDLAFVHATARSAAGRLLLAVLLKVSQGLGLFPQPAEPHAAPGAGLGAPDQVAVLHLLARGATADRSSSVLRHQRRRGCWAPEPAGDGAIPPDTASGRLAVTRRQAAA